MLLDYEKVGVFWKWFKTVESGLQQGTYNPFVIEEIDKFIQSLNDRLDWEIGPVKNMPSTDADLQYFCISPCLSVELLGLTHDVIKEAPNIKGWEFYSTKPKKGWIPHWEMYNEVGQLITINASTWKYLLYQFDDGTFDMDVKIDGIDGNQSTRNLAIEICIVNLLGEKRFMDEIKSVRIVDAFNQEVNGVELNNLESHLDNINFLGSDQL